MSQIIIRSLLNDCFLTFEDPDYKQPEMIYKAVFTAQSAGDAHRFHILNDDRLITLQSRTNAKNLYAHKIGNVHYPTIESNGDVSTHKTMKLHMFGLNAATIELKWEGKSLYVAKNARNVYELKVQENETAPLPARSALLFSFEEFKESSQQLLSPEQKEQKEQEEQKTERKDERKQERIAEEKKNFASDLLRLTAAERRRIPRDFMSSIGDRLNDYASALTEKQKTGIMVVVICLLLFVISMSGNSKNKKRKRSSKI